MSKEIKTRLAKGDIKFYRHYQGVGIVKHIGFDDNDDFVMASPLEDRWFSVRKVDFSKQYVELEGFDFSKLQRQTCGRRLSDYGPWERQENVDYWHDHFEGGELVYCSFCGSVAYDVFLKVIDAVNEGKEGYSIERASGKNYKFYLAMPGKSHIKFYTMHIPKDVFDDPEKLKMLNMRLLPACKKSWDRFLAKVRPPEQQ